MNPDAASTEKAVAQQTAPIIDPQLQLLVDIVNSLSLDTRFGVTLMAQGLVISGDLLPAEAWQRERAEVSGPLDALFLGYADKCKELRELDDVAREADAAPDPSGTASHIHLTNARIYTGVVAIPENGLAWRGRLTEITGWSLGKFSPTDE